MSSIQERSMITGQIVVFRSKLVRDLFQLAEFQHNVSRVDLDADEFSWTDLKGKTKVSSFQFKLILKAAEFRYWQIRGDAQASLETETELALIRQAATLNVPLQFMTSDELHANPYKTQNQLIGHSYLSGLIGANLEPLEAALLQLLGIKSIVCPYQLATHCSVPASHAIGACVSLWRSGLIRQVNDTDIVGTHWRVTAANAN
jgi:hypothetical protein